MLKTSSRGFTIVELLIVVVVIAILAAITIVAYNGISQKAKDSVVMNGLAQASKKVKNFAAENADVYPGTLAQVAIVSANSVVYQYAVNNDASPRTFCITASYGSIQYNMAHTAGSPQPGTCPQHAASITNLISDPSATSVSLFDVSGTSSPTKSLETSVAAVNGQTLFRATAVSNGSVVMAMANYPYVTSGKAYTASCWMKVSNGTRSYTLSMLWRDSNVAGVTPTATGTQTSVTSTWVRLTAAGTAPANASRVMIRINSGSSMAATNTVDVDACMLTEGSALYDYADGSSPNWSWDGTPNNSTSTGPAN